ncbi:APC family permease [Labrys wisconsinensis]|uniref:Amino acid transporter n=1 Tax=Labrys wisconsinensis TaxID=425677 RepID=A0ABU0J4H8_9HYPH|nr:APC family permease [Labrys wisconsinensis]MDQ0469179.1 amino acid transporter [Labrys wisconsinensis]
MTTPHAESPAAPGLQAGAIRVWESVLISIAASAPGQATAVSLGLLIPATAYAGGLSILATTAAMLAIAWSYHRLNMWHQNAGGAYAWVGRAVSPYLGYLVGCIMLAGYVLGTVSDILPIGPSVLTLLGFADVSNAWGEALSATILGGITMVYAVVGIHVTARFQTVISLIEHAILISFCVVGVTVVFVLKREGTVTPSWDWLMPSGIAGGGSIVAGMIIAVYLFTGWDTSIYLNEETERPEVNPGKAAIWSVAILGVYYAVLVVSLQGAASLKDIAAHQDSALIFIAHQLVGSPWDKVMAFAIVLSILGTTQAFLVAAARISFAMSRDGLLPASLGEISRTYRTPAKATIVFGVVMIAATWVYVFVSSVSGAFDAVVSCVGVMFALFYAVTGLTTSWAFRRIVTASFGNLVSLGLVPLLGAATLLYVAACSTVELDPMALWSLIAITAASVLGMVVARLRAGAAFFRLGPDAALGTQET